MQGEGLDLNKGALSREWIETNALGGLGMSTIVGAHTRKYHGWLTVLDPTIGEKILLLSKIEATLIVNGKEYELGLNRYPGSYHPYGLKYQKSFEHELFPIFHYEIKEIGATLSVSLMLIDGENRLAIRYQYKGEKEARLKLQPRLVCRGIHQLTHKNSDVNQNITEISEVVAVRKLFSLSPYVGIPTIYFSSDELIEFHANPLWFNNIEYQKENERGFPFHEDHFSVGTFEKELAKSEEVFFSVSTDLPKFSLRKIFHKESDRRSALSSKYGAKNHLGALKQHAENFLLKNGKGEWSITAGLPWFNEWGRDTMISLPGLTFYCDKVELGLTILKTWCSYEKEGLLPNYLPLKNGERPSYNSIDASLWFFWALSEYYDLTGDKKTIEKEFKGTMKNIINSYLDGKVPFAELTLSGLIYAGDYRTQLTWMDAMVDGNPVTPRYGMAVDINALWYHGISFFLELFGDGSDFSERLFELKDKVRINFINQFWSEERGYLADVVNEHGADFSIRPNQIFAVSLTHSPLTEKQMLKVVDCVKDELLTPMGLRTLSPKDQKFIPRYEGGPRERDSAYHQGTVWPWPVGHFTEAFLRVASNRANASRFLKEYFNGLLTSHLTEDGLFSIAEIFDATEPQRANGCPAQAWSVAEVIRAFELLAGNKKRERPMGFVRSIVNRFR